MKADKISGDPTLIPFQTWRRHEWLTMWNSDVAVKWINNYGFISYITISIFYEPINFNPCNAPLQRPDKTRHKNMKSTYKP